MRLVTVVPVEVGMVSVCMPEEPTTVESTTFVDIALLPSMRFMVVRKRPPEVTVVEVVVASRLAAPEAPGPNSNASLIASCVVWLYN